MPGVPGVLNTCRRVIIGMLASSRVVLIARIRVEPVAEVAALC